MYSNSALFSGISGSLFQQELGGMGSSVKKTTQSVDRLIQKNIAKCLFEATHCKFLTGEILDVVRNGKWIAFYDSEQNLFLYDLFVKQILWRASIPNNPFPGYLYRQLMLDKTGLVIKFLDYYENSIALFFEGQCTGNIFCYDYYMENFYVFNGFVFAIGQEENIHQNEGFFINRNKMALYQWDKNGQLILKISLKELGELNNYWVNFKKSYLTICNGGKDNVKVMLIDLLLKTSEVNIIKQLQSSDEVEVNSTVLKANFLFLSIRVVKNVYRSDRLFKIYLESKIVVFDIFSRKVFKEFPFFLHELKMHHLKATKDFVVFLLSDNNEKERLMCINTKNWSLNGLNPFSCTSFSSEIQFFLNKEFIFIFEKRKVTNQVYYRNKFVVDLSKNRFVYHLKESFYHTWKMTFDKGIFCFLKGKELFIQDFHTSSSEVAEQLWHFSDTSS